MTGQSSEPTAEGLTEAERETLEWAEMLTHQECAAKRHSDWFIDSEHNHLCPWCRAESAEAERDDLQRWKDEALPVIAGLQELGRALGVRLGARITGPEGVKAAEELRAERDDLRAALDRVKAERHVVHVTSEPVAEDVVWCDECEEWVMSGAVEGDRS